MERREGGQSGIMSRVQQGAGGEGAVEHEGLHTQLARHERGAEIGGGLRVAV